MNESIKNIFSYIKDALELKNKNIYDVNNYEKYYDLRTFYKRFENIIEMPDYEDINIFSGGTILKISYIKESNKKDYPEVPSTLSDYIYLNSDNDIIDKVDDLDDILNTNFELRKEYNEFEKNIKDINNYNEQIDRYNQIYMDLYNVYKRINDLEEKIEIILGTNLLYCKGRNNNYFLRHALEANLDITLNPLSNSISLSINTERFRGFVTDFLNSEAINVRDYSSLYDFVKKFNSEENDDHIDFHAALKKYLNYISLENEMMNEDYSNLLELKSNCLYSFENIGIIVRNKNIKLWIEDLDKITALCDNTEFLSPILNLFEVDFENELHVKEILDDPTYVDTKDDAVLFPLPSNDEQYQIVDKVKRSNIVLVQGPPGTGKSHTIANLLSHYVSEGKRVIVTSEKAKALEVLRDKIPEEIRSLSLALLTSTGADKDLEFSVETILKNQLDENQQNHVLEKVSDLTEQLKQIQEEKRNTSSKIIELMSKDTISYRSKLNDVMNFSENNKLTLMDIAIWLDENKTYNVISESDVENYIYPNISEFFEKLDNICDDIKNNKYAVNGEVPICDLLKNNELELSISENEKYKNYVPKYSDLMNAIRQKNINFNIVKDIKNDINQLLPLYDIFDKETLLENIQYEVFYNRIKAIKEKINYNHEFVLQFETNIIDYTIQYPNEMLAKYNNTMNSILQLYGNNDSIRLLDKLKLSNLLKEIPELLMNGEKITKDNISKGKVLIIVQKLYYDSFVDEICMNLKQILDFDLFEMYNINREQFGRYEHKIVKILDSILNFKKVSNDVNKKFGEIVNRQLFEIDYLNRSEEEIDDILADLNYYLIVNMNNNTAYSFATELRGYYKDYNLQNLSLLISAISENNEEEYIHAKNKLLSEINIINSYNKLKNNFSQFMTDKSDLTNKYIYSFNATERNFLKTNLDKILRYHYIMKFYLTLEENVGELPKLYSQRESLIKDERKIVKELIATKGWYYQSKYMTPSISVSLNKWVSLKKKRGAGTGKNAQMILKQMRAEMAIAKNAIPIWIMPIDRLIEQYPFENDPPFDVLIMDESSQSSIFSIGALTRAKKIIIVGDDKQISPTNAFQNLDDLNNLSIKYLKNNSWKYQISKDTSIYDIVQTVCGNKKITLTEHFRCLPEIIHYSNKEFYNMEINPLKVRGINETIAEPIKEIYVPNAYCQKKGSNYFNEKEIDRIIELVEEMSNDKQYDHKTIGIIALQNSHKYIQKIIELLMTKLGENFINERKLKVGNTYDFQGDERDVIILGMVIASIDEKGEKLQFKALTTKEFDKSFNVAASRAKEQMILVHSVRLEELGNTTCNRYRLLNYCMNYKTEEKQAVEKLFESDFERDVYYLLDANGFKLIPQFKVGNYRLDFVVENNQNQKIVIECDGDSFHGPEQFEKDLERQTVLERCGWKFVRIRASEFYYNKQEAITRIINEINNYLGNNISQAIKYSEERNSENQILKREDIHPKISLDNTIEKKEESLFEDLIEDNNAINENDFKYMVLFCEGVSKKEISKYYNVNYDVVKRALQLVASKYNSSIVEECIILFKADYENTEKYKNVIAFYKLKQQDLI